MEILTRYLKRPSTGDPFISQQGFPGPVVCLQGDFLVCQCGRLLPAVLAEVVRKSRVHGSCGKWTGPRRHASWQRDPEIEARSGGPTQSGWVAPVGASCKYIGRGLSCHHHAQYLMLLLTKVDRASRAVQGCPGVWIRTWPSWPGGWVGTWRTP